MQSLEVRSRVAGEAWARLPSQDTSQGQRSAPLFPWMVSIPTRPPGAFPRRGKSLVNEVIAGVRPNHVCLKRMCKSRLKRFLERNERGGLRRCTCYFHADRKWFPSHGHGNFHGASSCVFPMSPPACPQLVTVSVQIPIRQVRCRGRRSSLAQA